MSALAIGGGVAGANLLFDRAAAAEEGKAAAAKRGAMRGAAQYLEGEQPYAAESRMRGLESQMSAMSPYSMMMNRMYGPGMGMEMPAQPASLYRNPLIKSEVSPTALMAQREAEGAASYVQPSILDQFGLGGLVPDEYGPWDAVPGYGVLGYLSGKRGMEDVIPGVGTMKVGYKYGGELGDEIGLW